MRPFRGLAQEKLEGGRRLVHFLGHRLGDHVEAFGVDGFRRLLLSAGGEGEDRGEKKEASGQLRSL